MVDFVSMVRAKPFTVVLTEEELVQRLKNREPASFESLYDNYAPTMYGIILKIVKYDPPAADVLQEAFLKIWNQIEKYDKQRGTLFTWMLNITRNLAIDKIRSAEYKRSKESLNTETNLGVIDASRFVAQDTDYVGLQEYISKMKPEHKQLIDMLYFEGYSQSEVSKKLNIPLGTIKSRIKQAVAHLREVFEKEVKNYH